MNSKGKENNQLTNNLAQLKFNKNTQGDVVLDPEKLEEICFLSSQLQSLQEKYQLLDELCDQDLIPQEGLPVTSDDDERCARLADAHGFDGNVFRNLLLPSLSEEASLRAISKNVRQRINMIPRIIASIEEQNTRSASEYSKPKSPAEWSKHFDCSWDTLKKRFDCGKIRVIKLSTKSYRIHKDDL
ncbi:hypothetical protein Enr10x_00870 [Gimesia panareensis]|uniref:Uncharacterized protein n=1 Tax=Gimesia panareensis TaxID=2527978 RepID=A0A517PZI8_9PLAN|nr:hypothetical protein [Gimesia panareensis]QDT24795.1 hypothetical protein Enr10x_00870 [Gimesia panareensis]